MPKSDGIFRSRTYYILPIKLYIYIYTIFIYQGIIISTRSVFEFPPGTRSNPVSYPFTASVVPKVISPYLPIRDNGQRTVHAGRRSFLTSPKLLFRSLETVEKYTYIRYAYLSVRFFFSTLQSTWDRVNFFRFHYYTIYY